MSYLYADTSALLRAYFPDEAGHAELRAMLLEGSEPVGSSELARIEFASAARAAVSAGRLRVLEDLLDRFNAHCGPAGPIRLLAFDAPAVLPKAYALVLQHRLRASDAIHLAAAVEQYRPLAAGTDVVFVTRDQDQAGAAKALGFALR